MIDGEQPGEVLDDVFDTDRDRHEETTEDSGQPRDEHGRFAPKVEAEQPEQEPEAEAQPEQEQPEQVDRRVPLAELQSERKKRQELEALVAQQQQLYAQQMQALQRVPQQQPQQPQEVPDIFDDPDAYLNQTVLTPLQQQMMQQQHHFENARLDMSEDRARERFGDDVVDKATQAAQQMGILGSFAQGRHPYGDLVSWYQQANTLQEVGGDLEAYNQRLEQQIRAKVLEELKSGQTGQQPTQRFPTSLADQTAAGGTSGPAMTQQGLLDDMFRPDRDRKA